MKVGITATFQFSFFSGGGANLVLSVAELCKALGHEVVLVNTNGTQTWWDDIQSLKSEFPTILHAQEWKEQNGRPVPLDLLLEVASIVSKEIRANLAKQSVWVVRKPILLSDIENSIYPLTHQRRDLTGLTAIWAIDSEITKDELEYLQVLGRNIPVRHVPYVWSPTPLQTHKKEAGLPDWIQVLAFFIQQHKAIPAWSTHITETNNSASSSCTVPLVIMREVKQSKQVPLSLYKIHNADHISKSEFFLSNVFKHTQCEDLSGVFIGRQRLIDWILDPASVILAHSRFRPLRPYYLDALWCGIPIVHNSPLLKEVGGLYYYNDNCITEAVQQFQNLHGDLLNGRGMFAGDALSKTQEAIQSRFGVHSESVLAGWRSAFSNLPSLPLKEEKQPILHTSPPLSTKNLITILFTDMWEDFNPAYNMFLLMMREAIRTAGLTYSVVGCSVATLPEGSKPNLVVFGPFGTEYQKEIWKGIPKAHFTGENTAPVQEADVVLNMGFPHSEFVDEKYIRLPLWMLEIDWFGADIAKLQNPKPLPIDRCTRVYPEEIGLKKKFCAFVVTNPTNPLRNNSFHWLSQYKQVDSAGRLFNTIGDAIFAGQGGGGGELKKHEFLKNYKFCLAYENASSQGYTTEKLLHAKAAGCIPIYWGDPKVERDFDPAGFLDARTLTTPSELIDLVRKVDTDPSLYLRMMAVPALDDYKRDLVRRTLRQVAVLLLKASGCVTKEELDKVPKLIGAASTEEAATLGAALRAVECVPTPVQVTQQLPQKEIVSTKPAVMNLSEKLDFPVIVTYATHQYLASVQQLLAGFSIQKKQIPNLEIHVYLASDVPEESKRLLSSNYNEMKFFDVPVNEVPASFPDFWNPQHFAWKLWLYNKLNTDVTLKGRLVLYLDAGVFCSRWPQEWLHLAFQEGVCALEDHRQTNDQWCHSLFKEKMKMTEAEKQSYQIVAGIMAFRAGSPQANALFSEAYRLAQDRELIVGAKWEGIRGGKPYGHRHDQSILSLLTYRQKVARYPLDDVYCNISLRKTFMTGKAFYVHRGKFIIHQQFSPGIDDCYVINLERRKDRMKKLYENMPGLETRIERINAVDGKRLQLTPELARLFKPHDFLWKKAIMGCALSHLGLWYRLANEKKDINSYLILEDDVKLQPDWEARWNAAQPHIPENYDILYLGGILPPNREGFEANKEKINAHWSRVANNQMFGQREPNRYFHWCAYAYVLSKQGAEKVLNLLNAHDGYWTSADHMLCNHVEHMNLYFLDPLVAGCYQDDDPVYRTSAFNDFNRVDKFDSDLWNNDERFSVEEIERCLKEAEGKPIQLRETLIQVTEQMQPAKEQMVGKESIESAKAHLRPLLTPPPSPAKKRFVCLPQHALKAEILYEGGWLKELFGKQIPLQIDTIALSDPSPSDSPIVILQKPHFPLYEALFEKWSSDGKQFYILHLSDEYMSDDIDCYRNPNCLGIIRIYDRPDIPPEVRKKMVLIPLGYHHTLKGGSDNPADKTPRLPFRSYRWSFMGTKWHDREQTLDQFKRIEPNKLLLVDSWESKEKIQRQEYISVLLDSYFVPCPIGNNYETFRIYEALECGAVPLYVKQHDKDTLAEWLFEEIGLMPSSSWDEAAKLIENLLGNLPLLETYRTMILNRWIQFKNKLSGQIQTLLGC